MRHFISTEDWSRAELEELLDEADRLKNEPNQPRLEGRTVGLIFFNPSLRTRTSFEVGASELGANAVVLEPGEGAWPMEFETGTVMDGEAEEHVVEAARVLSRYCDLLGIRSFPDFEDWEEDRRDRVIRSFAEHATVPVVNMETITHPCQELALMKTIDEHAGEPDGREFLLTWTYHPEPLNVAVANSAVLIASKFGMDVTLLCPTEDYELDDRYMEAARGSTSAQGRDFRVTHDIEEAYEGADFVYAKSWGALPYYGDWDAEKTIRDEHRHFMVDAAKMERTDDALFSHCLPVRRNTAVADEVLDSDRSVAIDEAENRIHVQKALMDRLLDHQ